MSDVLIVYDNPEQTSPARRILLREGLTCSAVYDPDVAWKTLLFERPDLLLIDLDDAGDQGWEFIERIRGDLRIYAVPVLVMSGSRDDSTADRAHALSAEHVDKSFLASQIIERMQSAITRALEVQPPADGLPNLDRIRVRLVLADGLGIAGIVHVPGELDRFSDSWDAVMRDARTFIAVTEATRLHDAPDTDDEPLGFVLLRKSDIRLVVPQG